jgi:hypothetical protein
MKEEGVDGCHSPEYELRIRLVDSASELTERGTMRSMAVIGRAEQHRAEDGED